MQIKVRLSEFIRAEIEAILEDWEEFAKTLLNASNMDQTDLRDHARDMLLAIADDLDSEQEKSEQTAKSKGRGPEQDEESWAEVHGGDRLTSGFSVMETVSEFRALRASVVARWINTHPTDAAEQFEALTRFHEAIDQAVAESLEQYTTEKETETRLFGAILATSPDPIYVVDLEGRFLYANRATADLFALDPEAIIGRSTLDLDFPFATDLQRNIDKVISDQSTYRGQFVHTFSSEQGERFEYLLAPVMDGNQNTESIVGIFRDVTERALAEEKIWHNAHHDLLTGLPNRRLFLDRLEQEVKHARRGHLPLAVLFMDLDGFKEVNDSLGHELGDRLLTEVAKRLRDCVREDDTVARLGGDEFTVILAGAAHRNDVARVGQSILDTLAMRFRIAGHSLRISASIGISFYRQNASSPLALLAAADQAMYKAKESGSHQMCFHDPSDPGNDHTENPHGSPTVQSSAQVNPAQGLDPDALRRDTR